MAVVFALSLEISVDALARNRCEDCAEIIIDAFSLFALVHFARQTLALSNENVYGVTEYDEFKWAKNMLRAIERAGKNECTTWNMYYFVYCDWPQKLIRLLRPQCQRQKYSEFRKKKNKFHCTKETAEHNSLNWKVGQTNYIFFSTLSQWWLLGWRVAHTPTLTEWQRITRHKKKKQ